MENLLNLTGVSYILSLTAFIALGLFESFAGFKILHGVTVGFGILCGGALGIAFGNAACEVLLLNGLTSTVVVASATVVLAIIASMLAFRFHKASVFALNGFIAYLIAYSISSLFNMPEPASITVGILAALLIGFAAVKLYRPYAIVSTALFGGAMLYLAAFLIFKDRFGSIVNFITFAVCASAGASVQFVTAPSGSLKE